MRKICIINSKFPPVLGGGETFSYQIANFLVQKGYEVSVITSKLLERDLTKFQFPVYQIEGFNDAHLHLEKCLPQLYKTLKIIEPDVIHINNYLPYFVYQQICKDFKKVKVVFSTHNTPDFPVRVFGTFKDFETEFTFARKLLDEGPHSKIIAGSEYFKKSIQQIASKKQKIEIIPYSVDLNRFKPRNGDFLRGRYGFSKKDRVVLLPGRIIKRKGIDIALKTVLALPEDYRLFLPSVSQIEDSTFLYSLQNYIKENGLKKRVVLNNVYLDDDKFARIYAMADVVILPSYNEGFGIVLIEAMASGKVVIGSDIAGIDEVIEHGKNGLLAPPGDSEILAQTIIKACEDSVSRESLIQNGLKSANEKFNLERNMNKLLSVYKSL